MSAENHEPGRSADAIAWRRLLPGLAALLVVVAAISFLLAGGSKSSSLPGGARQSAAGGGYLGSLTLPVRAAPPIQLRNYRGQPVTLSQYRGRAVLVTFLYTHCPDVCPLIAANLHAALHQLGTKAAQVQLIAVSVDPRGDTSAAVAHFLHVHELTGRMQYLIGNSAELGRTWAAWDVGSRRDAGQPELVDHDALVYGVTASGRLTTVYPANFQPSEIAHDVPRLAAN
jgi:protein SCO1/2